LKYTWAVFHLFDTVNGYLEHRSFNLRPLKS